MNCDAIVNTGKGAAVRITIGLDLKTTGKVLPTTGGLTMIIPGKK